MKRKLMLYISMCLLIGILASAPANAAMIEPCEDNTLTDLVAQKIEDNMEASIINESGTELPLEVVDIEVNEINNSNIEDEGTVYSATAKVKTSNKSYKKNGISANGVLTMYWVDGSWEGF